MPTKITPVGVPDYLAEYTKDDQSLAVLEQYVILPRLKIIQNTTDMAVKQQFGEGTPLLWPGGMAVTPRPGSDMKGPPFLFCPLFFFVEYGKWSDLKDKGSPTIMERTFDPTSELAKRSRDPAQRKEKYGDRQQYTARYVESLNFPGYIYDKQHPLFQVPLTLTYLRGEFGKGQQFCTSIKLRRTPLWSQVWSLRTAYRDLGPDRKWWGFDHEPAADPNILKDDVFAHREKHTELKDLFEKKRLVVDQSGQDEEPQVIDESKAAL